MRFSWIFLCGSNRLRYPLCHAPSSCRGGFTNLGRMFFIVCVLFVKNMDRMFSGGHVLTVSVITGSSNPKKSQFNDLCDWHQLLKYGKSCNASPRLLWEQVACTVHIAAVGDLRRVSHFLFLRESRFYGSRVLAKVQDAHARILREFYLANFNYNHNNHQLAN